MTPATVPPEQEILVVEQVALVGSIIVSTARQMNLPRIRLLTSIRAAEQHLALHRCSGLITSLDELHPALELIQKLRCGDYRALSDTPLAVTASQCGAELASTLKLLDVRRVLLKPFKVRDVILTIGMLSTHSENALWRTSALMQASQSG